LREGTPFVHAHITLSDKEGRAFGGHLLPGCEVGATFELTLYSYDDIKLQRKFDAQRKLFLMDI
jgi:predicted DNA-binding protein with PD1-like motif